MQLVVEYIRPSAHSTHQQYGTPKPKKGRGYKPEYQSYVVGRWKTKMSGGQQICSNNPNNSTCMTFLAAVIWAGIERYGARFRQEY
jgi:hypothetical protein